MTRDTFDIVVLGGSIAALKCASILTSLCGKGFRIGLVSVNDRFLFLPLIPDIVSGRVSKGFATCDINAFCTRRGIAYYQSAVKSIAASKSTISLYNGEELHYRFLIIGTGNPLSNSCDQTYWQDFLSKTLVKGHDKDVVLDGASIATFEVTAAIASLPQHPRITIRTTSGRPKFSTHPWLGSINEIKNSLNYADSLVANKTGLKTGEPAEDATVNNDALTRLRVQCDEAGIASVDSVYSIGTHRAFGVGIRGSAQYSSFTAKIAALRIWMMMLRLPLSGILSTRLGNYPFGSRGTMLFSGADCAGIWLGSNSPVGRRPNIYGPLAASLRRLFYCTQMQLFYSSRPFSRLGMRIYAVFILLTCLTWVVKEIISVRLVSKVSPPPRQE